MTGGEDLPRFLDAGLTDAEREAAWQEHLAAAGLPPTKKQDTLLAQLAGSITAPAKTPLDRVEEARKAGLDFTAHRHPCLAVACPDCKARAGAWCKRPSGHMASSVHASRGAAADAAWGAAKLPTLTQVGPETYVYDLEGENDVKPGPKEEQIRALKADKRAAQAAPTQKETTMKPITLAPVKALLAPDTGADTAPAKTTTAGDLAKKAAATRAQIAADRKAAKKTPAKKAGAKKAPPKKAKTAKKAPAPKPAGKKAEPLGKPNSIGAIANAAILAGKSNEEALAAVKKVHPVGKTNVGNISWYRGQLKKKGLLK